MAEAYVTRCSNIRPKLEKLQIADLVDMPNINNIFKHLPRPYTKKLQGIGNYISQNQKTNITGRSICYSVLKYPHRTGKTSDYRPGSHTHRLTSCNSMCINLKLPIGDANPAM
jgi:hypothetical protein